MIMELIKLVLLMLIAVTAMEGRSVDPPQTAVKNEYFDSSIPSGETTLTAEDFANAKKLPKVSPGAIPYAKGMQNPNMFEGDIANKGLNSSTINAFLGKTNPNDTSGAMRNAIKGAYKRWPNATIPYTISTQFTPAAKAIIADAMNQFTPVTCIKFIPQTNQANYVSIIADTAGTGCYSHVGMVGGRQNLSLGEGCVTRGVIMHELMHAVGLWHEQSRSDRDQYVEILLQNVRKGMEYAFDKYDTDNLNLPYDYYSIMHYGPAFLSSNKEDTIRPVKSARDAGVRLQNFNPSNFTDTDIYELNILGQCCFDQKNCPSWAASGYCNSQSVHYSYMQIFCKKSCRFC